MSERDVARSAGPPIVDATGRAEAADRTAPARLKGVTLIAATSVALEATVDALEISARQATFDRVVLLSDQPPVGASWSIEWRRIDRLNSRADYSLFMLRELANHVSTPHALCIQWDGFVLNGGAWDDEFLRYDYIGAVWPHFRDGHNVGNGGFSLRSKRLLELCKALPVDERVAEDLLIARTCRSLLEREGIRFAPESVARKFSYERTPTSGREFGFHGAFNLVRHRHSSEILKIFRQLEPGLLAPSELWEILRWALMQGRIETAFVLASRIVTRGSRRVA